MTPRSSVALLRTLRAGLLVYGAIGIALAVIAIVVAVGVGARASASARDVDTRVQSAAQTMVSAAATLERAAAPIGSAGRSVGSILPAIDGLATSLDSLELTTRGIAQQIGSFEILGQKPFGAIADPVDSLAGSIAQAGDSAAAIATQVRNQGDALQETGDAMAKLAVDLRDTSEVLKGGLVGDAMNAFAAVVLAFVLMAAVFFGFTALGALIGGIWLQRWIDLEVHRLFPEVAPAAPVATQPPPSSEPPA